MGFAPWPGLDEPKPVISGVTPQQDSQQEEQPDA
jgi:hypothetical protein